MVPTATCPMHPFGDDKGDAIRMAFKMSYPVIIQERCEAKDLHRKDNTPTEEKRTAAATSREIHRPKRGTRGKLS